MSCIASAVSWVSTAGLDGEEPPAAGPVHHVHALVGDQAILGLVGAGGQQR